MPLRSANEYRGLSKTPNHLEAISHSTARGAGLRPGDQGERADELYMNIFAQALFMPALLLVGVLAPTCKAMAQAADAIYTGGDIVTVNDRQPAAEAVAVKDGRILAVGALGAIEQAA